MNQYYPAGSPYYLWQRWPQFRHQRLQAKALVKSYENDSSRSDGAAVGFAHRPAAGLHLGRPVVDGGGAGGPKDGNAVGFNVSRNAPVRARWSAPPSRVAPQAFMVRLGVQQSLRPCSTTLTSAPRRRDESGRSQQNTTVQTPSRPCRDARPRRAPRRQTDSIMTPVLSTEQVRHPSYEHQVQGWVYNSSKVGGASSFPAPRPASIRSSTGPYPLLEVDRPIGRTRTADVKRLSSASIVHRISSAPHPPGGQEESGAQ